MNNRNILCCFLIMILIIYIISIKESNKYDKFTNKMDVLQDIKIEQIKQKLKK